MLSKVYGSPSINCSVQSIADLVHVVDRHAPSSSAETKYIQHFAEVLKQIPSHSVVHFEGFAFGKALEMFGENLKQRNCKLTIRIQEGVSEHLSRFRCGQELLKQLATADTVFVHTDLYKQRLEQQLHDLGLYSGGVRRFDMGIDTERVRSNRDWFASVEEIPSLNALAPAQQEFLREIRRSRETVPHRFICIDRLDAIKGVETLIHAIRSFLDHCAEAGEGLEERQQKYRFYFLQSRFGTDDTDAIAFNAHYGREVVRLLEQTQEAHPGIVWYSPSFEGVHSKLVPSLIRGCHAMTGGAEEGLNIGLMEVAIASEFDDVGMISGRGAGFAWQSVENGAGDLGEFVEPGNIAAIRDGLRRLVHQQAAYPGVLKSNKAKLIRSQIVPRRDSMIAT